MSNIQEDRIQRCKELDLKSVIEAYGGEFKRGMFSAPSVFGYEATPAGKIYMKNGEQRWWHHREAKGGDAIEWVKVACGVDTNKAINMLLGEEKGNIKRDISPIDRAELIAREMREKALKEEKDRKTLFAITKNSIPLMESNLCCQYLMNRGISTAALTLRDPRIQIFENSFKDKDGNEQHRIGYLFQGNGKGSHRFMILKGIDEDGNKTGFKQNLMKSRPVFHQSQIGKPFIVCEGVEDALSAKEMQYSNFISLNSVSNVNQLLQTINQCPKFYKNNTFELALDTDKAGLEATKQIYDFMKGKGLDVKISEYHEIMKELNINDLNDLLIKEYIDPVDRLMDWSKGSKEMER